MGAQYLGLFFSAEGEGVKDVLIVEAVDLQLSRRTSAAAERRGSASTIVAEFFLGYSSRLAFGCNVGAFFSGVSTGSLHGWAWFVAAFIGSYYGIKLRPMLKLEARP